MNKLMKEIIKGKVCAYCKNKTIFIDSIAFYKESYGMCYACLDCKAWVGVHKDSNRALGRVANKELRKYKVIAHFT